MVRAPPKSSALKEPAITQVGDRTIQWSKVKLKRVNLPWLKESFETGVGTSVGKMPDIKRTIKLVTQQAIMDDSTPAEGELPMRKWSIEILLLDNTGKEVPNNLFEKVQYNLHPSFANPTQVFKSAPFRCENEGWGEFDMTIELTALDKGGKHTIAHDLNFTKARYESKHVITFKSPNAALLGLLSHSGPVPGGDDVNGGFKKESSSKKRKRPVVDIDKLADSLVKLNEDDLLRVVQMVHDNKTDETYTKNDVENGEFHVDLYTLPDTCLRMMMDFVSQKDYL